MRGYRPSPAVRHPLPSVRSRFGIRSAAQVRRDLSEMARAALGGGRFQVDVRSLGLLRPDLSLPAYAGLVPENGLAPIYNLFDRVGGGRAYSQRVSRRRARDFRGGRLSYDEHDGTDLVCPVGTPLVAAAPGRVVMIRDRWLRGGLTVAVDHGHGLVTQYTHCSEVTVAVGACLRRGAEVALSGTSGLDLVQFFPWVPPHIHFMVLLDGRPLDPFRAQGEPDGAGAWLERNAPAPSGPLPDEPKPLPSPVDDAGMQRLVDACTDARVAAELRAPRPPEERAALLEDALTHDRYAFPADLGASAVRPPMDAARLAGARALRLSLPLPCGPYRGAAFADARFTRPPSREGALGAARHASRGRP